MPRNLVVACLCLVAVARPLANDPYDSTCPHPMMIHAPPPDPAPGTFFAKRLTTAAKEDKAVCIDGTTPIVYVKPGNGTGSKKWYIHHEGGGWCNDLNGCLYRSETPLGSTLNDTDTMVIRGGYFDFHPLENPYMYNWNMAYLRYCDGGSFSGNNANPTPYRGKELWFRGFHILHAAMTELIDNNGLKEATDVVISGCSAGGLATYLHADQWADKLRPILGPNARIKAMPDSGFFPDYNGPPGYENRVKNVSAMQNITAALPQECVKQYPENEVWKCFFAENVSPYIQIPVFPLQSRFDTWQIGSDLGTNDTVAVNAWGEKLVQTIHQRLLDHAPDKHGIFLDSCAHHCGEFGYIYINGINASRAFNDWFVGTGTQHVWFQNETYPCSWCCKNPPAPAPKAE